METSFKWLKVAILWQKAKWPMAIDQKETSKKRERLAKTNEKQQYGRKLKLGRDKERTMERKRGLERDRENYR